MSLELDIVTALSARLTDIETDSTRSLLGALPFEKYMQACGYLECIRQVRDVLLPEIVKDLQEK